MKRVHVGRSVIVGVPEQKRVACSSADFEAGFEEENLPAGIVLVEVDQHREDALIGDIRGAIAVGLELLARAVAQDLQWLAPVGLRAAGGGDAAINSVDCRRFPDHGRPAVSHVQICGITPPTMRDT